MSNLLFLFNFAVFSNTFKPHYSFKSLLLPLKKKTFFIFNINSLFIQWTNAVTLLYYIFKNQTNPLTLGTSKFKSEILSLNWTNINFSIEIWKYAHPFLIFNHNSYSPKIDYLFKKLYPLTSNWAIVTNPYYHYKNIFYLRKNNYLTFSLIFSNLNPWLVDYPLVTFSDNYIFESLFIKLILFIKRKAEYDYYAFQKTSWLNFKF